jgi:hypothetical protein
MIPRKALASMVDLPQIHKRVEVLLKALIARHPGIRGAAPMPAHDPGLGRSLLAFVSRLGFS